MNRNVLLALGALVVVVVVVALVYKLGPTIARNQTLSRCAKLKQDLAAAQQAGSTAAQLATLQQQIAQCTADANAQGANLDPSLETLQACLANFEAVQNEFGHLKAIDYSDTVQRANVFNNMMEKGERGVQCMVGAIQTATTKETLQAIRAAIMRYGRVTRGMQEAFFHGESGTDRFLGSSETAPNIKAHNVKQRIQTPLWGALAQVDQRILALDATDATVRAELATVQTSAEYPGNSIWGP